MTCMTLLNMTVTALLTTWIITSSDDEIFDEHSFSHVSSYQENTDGLNFSISLQTNDTS